jgi:uncharacterized membrane protein YqiK
LVLLLWHVFLLLLLLLLLLVWWISFGCVIRDISQVTIKERWRWQRSFLLIGPRRLKNLTNTHRRDATVVLTGLIRMWRRQGHSRIDRAIYALDHGPLQQLTIRVDELRLVLGVV